MAGFFGKMPSIGDFVSRDLPQEVKIKLDDWFQTGLTHCSETLDVQWDLWYREAPIWHFYFSSGVVDESPWLGLWIASIDSAGRKFPLSLLAPMNQPLTDMTSIYQYDPWFANCEDILFSVFNEPFDVELFCYEVQRQDPEAFNQHHQAIKQALSKAGLDIPLDKPTTQVPQELFTRLDTLECAVEEIQQTVQKIAQCLDIQLELNHGLTKVTDNVAQIKGQLEPQTKRYSHFEYAVNLEDATHQARQYPLWPESSPFVVWSSSGNNKIGKQLVVTEGLPEKSVFSKFITGFD